MVGSILLALVAALLVKVEDLVVLMLVLVMLHQVLPGQRMDLIHLHTRAMQLLKTLDLVAGEQMEEKDLMMDLMEATVVPAS